MGGGVGWLAVNGLRRRRRAAVAIALLVGVVGSIVLATVAGARRSDSSLRRTLERRVLAIPAFAAEAHATPQIIAEAIGGPTRPPEIDRLRNTVWIAPALAGLMSVLALIALAHALVTTARRRRHELAVLKALGFDRAQVRVTLAWQATTLAVVGLLLGLPLGVVVGRIAWLAVATRIGVAPTVAVPGLAVAALVPVTLLLVNLVASLPARAASRIRTSVALAAE